MPTHLVLLVLFAALLHAGWNALLRGGADRLWSMTVMCVAIAIVCAVAAMFMVAPAPQSWGYALLSALLHVGYNLFLVRSYRVGDLGQIYPISRGSSPALITLGAALFAGETITPGELLGIANAQNGSGDYLFSGYQGATKPFAIDASQSAVAYYGDDVAVDALQFVGLGHAQCGRDGDGSVARPESVVGALLHARKSADAA